METNQILILAVAVLSAVLMAGNLYYRTKALGDYEKKLDEECVEKRQKVYDEKKERDLLITKEVKLIKNVDDHIKCLYRDLLFESSENIMRTELSMIEVTKMRLMYERMINIKPRKNGE